MLAGQCFYGSQLYRLYATCRLATRSFLKPLNTAAKLAVTNKVSRVDKKFFLHYQLLRLLCTNLTPVEMSMKKLLVAALLSVNLVACGGSSDSDVSLRVIHNSPDAPAVDVKLNGDSIVENVSYLGASDFLSVNSGATHIQVVAAGTDTAVINADVTLNEGGKYTVIASDKLASIRPIILTSTKIKPANGNLLVRVSHGAPSAPAVDVYVTAANASLAEASPVLSGVPFGTTSQFLEIPSGEYQLRVTLAGTKTVAIDSGAVALNAESILTVLARDAVGGGAPFSLGVFEEK